MKFLTPLIILGLILFSCKKDEIETVSESDCLFTSTSNSYSALDLGQLNNSDVFIMNLNADDDANGLRLDINCDGINDIEIAGDADQDWVGFSTIASSRLSITTLNSNTYVLKDSIVDSTFSAISADTNNFQIDFDELVSSYPTSSSVLTSTTTNAYVTNVDSNAVLLENDPRWTYSYYEQLVRDRYKRVDNFDTGPDANGYMHYVNQVWEYNRGIAPNHEFSWIPIKCVTTEGYVKMGFIKLRMALHNGFINVGVDCWGIQK